MTYMVRRAFLALLPLAMALRPEKWTHGYYLIDGEAYPARSELFIHHRGSDQAWSIPVGNGGRVEPRQLGMRER